MIVIPSHDDELKASSSKTWRHRAITFVLFTPPCRWGKKNRAWESSVSDRGWREAASREDASWPQAALYAGPFRHRRGQRRGTKTLRGLSEPHARTAMRGRLTTPN